MCGYCTEQIAFQALQSLPGLYTTSDKESFKVWLYLQEETELLEALHKLNPQVITRPGVGAIILCRAIEILITQGANSDTYQKLLEHPHFSAAIKAGCSHYEDGELPKAENPFKTSHINWVTDSGIYLTPVQFEQNSVLLSNEKLYTLLRDYIDWWLVGGANGAVPIDFTEDEFDSRFKIFKHYFPSLWFAVLRVGNLSEKDSILLEVITKLPSEQPDFDALDLWLQRRAALTYCDQHGFGTLLKYLSSIRPEIFQYLALARIISTDDKNFLVSQAATLESCHDLSVSEWQLKS